MSLNLEVSSLTLKCTIVSVSPIQWVDAAASTKPTVMLRIYCRGDSLTRPVPMTQRVMTIFVRTQNCWGTRLFSASLSIRIVLDHGRRVLSRMPATKRSSITDWDSHHHGAHPLALSVHWLTKISHPRTNYRGTYTRPIRELEIIRGSSPRRTSTDS
jgi:hypothetical protein